VTGCVKIAKFHKHSALLVTNNMLFWIQLLKLVSVMQAATGYQILLAISPAYVMVTLLLMELANNVLICFPYVESVILVMVSLLEIFILVLQQVLANISPNISIVIYVLETFGTTLTKEDVLHAILRNMDV